MARYIDAEKLKCSIDSETDSIFDWDMTIEELYYNLCKLVDDEPTADVQEVKHGEWENQEPGYRVADFMCSVCHSESDKLFDYCPDCGARMDAESNG